MTEPTIQMGQYVNAFVNRASHHYGDGLFVEDDLLRPEKGLLRTLRILE